MKHLLQVFWFQYSWNLRWISYLLPFSWVRFADIRLISCGKAQNTLVRLINWVLTRTFTVDYNQLLKVCNLFSINIFQYPVKLWEKQKTPWSHPEIEGLLMSSKGIERNIGQKCNEYFRCQLYAWEIYICKVPYVC